MYSSASSMDEHATTSTGFCSTEEEQTMICKRRRCDCAVDCDADSDYQPTATTRVVLDQACLVCSCDRPSSEHCYQRRLRQDYTDRTRRRHGTSRFLAVAFLLACFTTTAFAKQMALFDTRNATKELKWQTSSLPSKYTDESSNSGWMEETFPHIADGQNHRAYVVCDVESNEVDNWLRTPWIQRPTDDVKRIHIEISFTMRDCREFPGNAVSCKETFSLFFYESDYDFAKSYSPEWTPRVWNLVDRITPTEGRFSNARDSVLNIEKQSINVQKKGVYFALRDQGGCTSILAIRIYYEVCNEVVTNLAHFPITHTGSGKHSLVKATGACIGNAIVDGSTASPPEYYCKADGTMDAFTGGCVCDRGYTPDVARGKCNACPPSTFKATAGDAACLKCPEHSDSADTAARQCPCLAGYYRATNDLLDMQCTRPPDKPLSVRMPHSDATSVVVEWTEPGDKGGRSDIWYRVKCTDCPTTAQFSPGRGPLNVTRVTISGLQPGGTYSVLVTAENAVSHHINLPQYAVIETHTAAVTPIRVPGLNVISVSQTQATLEWERAKELVTASDSRSPHSNAALAVKQYIVRYFVEDSDEVGETRTTVGRSFTFDNLSPNKKYRFQVRANTNRGPSSWSDYAYAVTTAIGDDVNKQNGVETVNPWLIALIIALMLIVVLLLLVCWIARRNRGTKKLPSDLDVLDYKNDQSLTPDYNNFHAFGTLPMNQAKGPSLMHNTAGGHHCYNENMRPTAGFKNYVDPTLYEDPNQALTQFAPEIDPQDVTIENIIGAGEFGEVCKGSLRLTDGRLRAVALKTLKTTRTDAGGSSNASSHGVEPHPHDTSYGTTTTTRTHSATLTARRTKENFLIEASIMGQFDHPNVIRLIGVVTRNEPVMIVTEFMENGSLDAFLRRHDGLLGVMRLVELLAGVAAGMKYLSDKGYVHRDLAARNVLVDTQLTCKIADFGLSRETEGSEEVYTTKGGKIPVRWTAPEAITHRKFTTASDVWSFGIVAWEVASYGERPYYDWSNQEVIEAVNHQGYRLPKPMDCPVGLHALMLRCWEFERTRRPTFDDIVLVLNDFGENPHSLNEIVNFSLCSGSSPLDVTSSSVSGMPPGCAGTLPGGARGPPPPLSQEELLSRLGLLHCHQRLAANGVRSVDQLLRLNVIDYLSYGVGKEEALRIQIYLQHHVLGAPRPACYQTLPRNGPPPFPPAQMPGGYHMVTTLQPQQPQALPRRTLAGGAAAAEGFFV